MRDAREHQAGSKERFAKRIIAAIAAVAMLGGVGYATATTAVAEEEAGTLATESFMGTTVGSEWTLLNDACLTAGGDLGCEAKGKANGDRGIYGQSNGLLQLTGDENSTPAVRCLTTSLILLSAWTSPSTNIRLKARKLMV